MIDVELILGILETALWTGALKDEKPLSLMLIASVGDGKSEMLRKSYKPPKIKTQWKDMKGKDGKVTKGKLQQVEHIGSVLYTTDTTPYTLYHKWGELLKSGQIKHIVIPDFLSVLTKGKEAMPETVRFYNSLIEEGICRIESRYSDFITEIPVQIGLITAVSFQDYQHRSKTQNWGALGFLSRVLPVSFRYSDDTKKRILHSTFLKGYHNEGKFALNLPDHLVSVELPGKYEAQMLKLANALKDPSDKTGARRLKQLMTFVMADALKHGRDIVGDEELARLWQYSEYFNPECKPLAKDTRYEETPSGKLTVSSEKVALGLHRKEEYICGYCDATFASGGALVDHWISKHHEARQGSFVHNTEAGMTIDGNPEGGDTLEAVEMSPALTAKEKALLPMENGMVDFVKLLEGCILAGDTEAVELAKQMWGKKRVDAIIAKAGNQ